MSRARAWRRAAAGIALASAAAFLSSCAAPPRPVPLADDLAARYGAGRAQRESALGALTADLVLRVDGRATGKLPGVPATLALAAPSRARLRVSALFGTALDVCAQGDSVIAWVPSERTALALGGASETLGIAPPVELLARSLGATWKPPGEAWRVAAADSLGLRVRWLEGADSLELRLDTDARPSSVRLASGEGSVTVRYGAWTRTQGTEWPAAIEIADGTGWARVRVGVDQLRAAERPDDGWFALRVPESARRLDWDGLREWLDRRREAR